MTTTDKDTDKAPRRKAKSKGYKGKGMVKRVGPEGLLDPMQYWDVEGARHYAYPYGCPKEVVDFWSIEGMWGHIRKVHGKGTEGFRCDWCGSYTSTNKDALRYHEKKYHGKYDF